MAHTSRLCSSSKHCRCTYSICTYILISLGGKQTVARSASRMSFLALSFRVLAGNASSGFKVLCQENNSFITVLLVSSPRFVTSVEDNMKIKLNDKQQTGFVKSHFTKYDVHNVLHINPTCKKKWLFRDRDKTGSDSVGGWEIGDRWFGSVSTSC